MGNQDVEILLADEKTWGDFIRNVGAGWKPPQSPGIETKTPFVANGQSWQQTISKVLAELDARRHRIRFLKIMAHGVGGRITCGVPLNYTDLGAINEFSRLRPFCAPWLTSIYLVGCEAAADGACVPGAVQANGTTYNNLCVGPFTGDTTKPGYLLLSRIADAINAPVHASPWKQAFATNKNGWQVTGARLTVGPGGGWVYDPAGTNGNTATTFGSPSGTPIVSNAVAP